MPTFGTSISSYNKKPSSVLTKYQNKAVVPAAITAPGSTPIDPMKQAAQPKTADVSKSALGGSSNLNASGLVAQIDTPVFQPHETGDIGKRRGGEYNRLNAIDQTTTVLNNEMDQKVANFNGAARAKNAASSYAGGQDMYGGGEGSGLDGEQLQYARQIASVGKSRGMDDNAIRIALMTALTESGLRNLNHGDRDSVGLFQQRTSQGWGSVQQIMDPNYSANKFYDSLAKTNYNGMSPWQAAQAVQRSFDPTGGNYQRQYALAQKAFNSLTPREAASMGINTMGQSNSAAGFIASHTNKYIDMDGAYGAQCVDLYNAYTQRFVGGQRHPVGWAPEIFNNYDQKAYTRLGANQGAGRMGDVAVFNRGGSTPLGHVSIVVGDNGNGTLRVLSSNYGSGPSGTMNSVIHNISKSSLMGYLRPNRLM